jgi:putative ABC transport system permease protein
LVAGYLGIAAGVLALEAVARAVEGREGPLHSPSVDIAAAVLAATVLLVVGVLAGVMPALHAARIRPVVALRAD